MDTEVIQAIQENTAALNQLIQLIQAKETRSDWVDPEEAAVILGLKITKAGRHRAKIRWLVKYNFIKQYQTGRPYKYYRTELEKVSKKIATGDIAYIGSA